MHNFIRYYNQNRKMIWGIAIIIAFLIVLLQLINHFVGQKNSNMQNQFNHRENTEEILENAGLESTYSAVTGEIIPNHTLESMTEVINQFFKYCNEGNIEQAYDLLTDECKEEMYNTIQRFQEDYYKYIFQNTRMSYTMENWANNTYHINFKRDLLSSGGKVEGEKFSDYITVVRTNDGYKLNINSYIGRTEIGSVTEHDGISVTVESKDTYMEYETYKIKVKNDTGEDIILDPKEDTKSTYIVDSNGVRYVAFLNEIPDNDLYIKNKYEKILKIKFSNNYSSNRKIENMFFNNIEKQNNSKERITFYANI